MIYTSGYSPGMAGKDVSLLEGRNFLPKPYSIGKLAQFVRECLDTPVKPGEPHFKSALGTDEIAALPTNGKPDARHLKSEIVNANGAKIASSELEAVLRN